MNQPPFTSNKWFVCPQPNSGAETRLFLFPYAGGGPAVFGKWPAALPSTIETWVAHYPGRGSRHNEPSIKQISALVKGLSKAIQPLSDKPYAFFGHSMGGMVAFELIRQLRKQNLPRPNILFVSACGAPQLPDPHQPIHELPDPELLSALKELNGIPTELLNYPEIMEVLLPVLRADFELVENYCYTPNQPSLDIPIIAYGGLDDSRISKEHLEGWASQTNCGFKSSYFPGDHFFINGAKDEILRSIVREIISSPTMKSKPV